MTLNTRHKLTETTFWLQFIEPLSYILGYKLQELANKPWTEFTYTTNHQVKNFQANQKSYVLEKQFVHKNGDIVEIAVDIKCVKNTNKMLGFLAKAITGSSGSKLEHCPLGLLIKDNNGEVMLVSERSTQGKRMKVLNMTSKF